MRKKIIRVRPVSKLDPKTLAGGSESVFKEIGNDMVLDVGKAFWQKLFSLDFDSLKGN
ncbi:MAG: hypothetical protein QG650_780 [Patescibacteria group bacterium]|nr:hypothetical protein [Patescibacteria group bacterium]